MADEIKIWPHTMPIQGLPEPKKPDKGESGRRIKGILTSVRKGRKQEGYNVAYMTIKVVEDAKLLKPYIGQEAEVIL